MAAVCSAKSEPMLGAGNQHARNECCTCALKTHPRSFARCVADLKSGRTPAGGGSMGKCIPVITYRFDVILIRPG